VGTPFPFGIHVREGREGGRDTGRNYGSTKLREVAEIRRKIRSLALSSRVTGIYKLFAIEIQV
jgi:hypothetical protein